MMNTTLKQKVSEIFEKYQFSQQDAQFISDLLGEIDDRQRIELSAKLDNLLNQKDKTELTGLMQKDKTELIDRINNVKSSLTIQIYIVGLIQFLAIVGSVIGIINFMIK